MAFEPRFADEVVFNHWATRMLVSVNWNLRFLLLLSHVAGWVVTNTSAVCENIGIIVSEWNDWPVQWKLKMHSSLVVTFDNEKVMLFTVTHTVCVVKKLWTHLDQTFGTIVLEQLDFEHSCLWQSDSQNRGGGIFLTPYVLAYHWLRWTKFGMVIHQWKGRVFICCFHMWPCSTQVT